jgi:hypothetical protein
MSTDTVSALVDRLTQAGPLTPERFAALLETPLQPGTHHLAGHTYRFALARGPFRRGELRLSAAGETAVLILEARTAPGLDPAEVDRAALGERLGQHHNPRIPPQGTDTEYYQKGAVQVAAQWLPNTHRLRTLVLTWAPVPSPGP